MPPREKPRVKVKAKRLAIIKLKVILEGMLTIFVKTAVSRCPK